MGAVKDFHDITTRAKDILVVHIVRDVTEMKTQFAISQQVRS